MKLYQDNCHLLVSGHNHETFWPKIGEAKVWESNKPKLLGVVIDRNLNFDEYVFDLCKKKKLVENCFFNKAIKLYEFW